MPLASSRSPTDTSDMILPRLSAYASATLLLSCFIGCASSYSAHPRVSMPATASSGKARIAIDGDISDWPTQDAFYANSDWLYFRFMVQDQVFTLQAAPSPVTLFLDTDGDASTGRRFSQAALQEIGADLEIVFSPSETNGKGAAAFVLDSQGHRDRIATTDLDLLFAPTYASQWYEGRISRHLASTLGLPISGLRSQGSFAGFVAFGDTASKLSAYSDPSQGTLEPVGDLATLATVDLPKKPPHSIRVMSWNVENTSPVKHPAPFRNAFQLLDPDLVLVQEWDEGDSEAVKGWFTAMVPGADWHVVKAPGDKSNGGGVAIISKFAITPSNVGRLSTEPDRATGPKPVRFVAATVTSPMGRLIVGTTHLKSGGTKDSSEDRRRTSEARAINAAFRTACEDSRLPTNSIRLIAGDMNLVGSRPPLDILRAGLDANEADLDIAQAWPLGDDAMYTWQDASTPFTPGRLDYVTFSSSSAIATQSFVFDTRRLSEESLARMGMTRDDSACSDHLPIVVDLQWRK